MEPAPARSDAYTALLIEDDAKAAKRLMALLEKPSDPPFAIEHVSTFEAGIERLAQGHVDVVLLDLDLPDSRGLDTVMRTVAANLQMPIIVLCEADDVLLSTEVIGRGAQDCLAKRGLEQPMLVRTMWHAIQRHAMQSALTHMSLVDELTGLYNRRGFLALAEQQMKLAQRTSKPLTLAFADLDNLKGINDTYGHNSGDEAIIRAAEALRRAFRNSDIIGRMGGDEFTVLMVDSGEEGRTIIDNRMRQILEEMNLRLKLPFEVSLSLGTARFEPDKNMSVEELIRKADKSLYLRKRARKKEKE